MRAARSTEVPPAPRGAGEIARAYTIRGVEHILSGIDHLLFVAGLCRGHCPAILDRARPGAAPQADVLALHAIVGYSLKEVSRTTSTPLNTVKSRLRLDKQARKQRIESDPRLIEALELAP